MEEKIVATDHIAEFLMISIIFIWNRDTIVFRRTCISRASSDEKSNEPLIFFFAVIKYLYREAVAINHRLICLQTKSIDL